MTKAIRPPSLEEIEAMARDAFAQIPSELAGMTGDVAFHVQDFAEEDVLKDLGIESPFDLMGLYAGIPFGERSVSTTATDIDRIFLYRRAILDYWCESGEDLAHVVKHVLIHEIGHHFGLSDADMERIEEEA